MKPRQTTESFPASFLVRVLAMIYDLIVVIGIWVFTIVVMVTVAGDAVVGAWVQSVLFIELFAFFAFFWINRGQTVGMQAWRLRLYAEGPINLQLVLRRFIGALVGGAVFFLGYFWILWDKDKRSWSDILSESQVLRESKNS